MTSLTDRYVAAVLQHIPTNKRTDVERELASSIADAIDDRVANGEGHDSAERDVLESMGDPARLAASMAGRRMYLIGPSSFLEWRRLMTVLLSVVVPISAIAVGVIELARDGEIAQAIVAGLGAGINVAVHLAFWVTLIFVLVERADWRRTTDEGEQPARWTVDQLPAAPATRISLSDTVGEIITLVITIAGLLILRGLTWADDATGQEIPILHPSIVDWWVPLLVLVLLTLLGFRIMLHILGRWTMPMAVAHAVLSLAFALPIVYLALTGTLVNPAFAAAVGYPPLAEGDGPVMVLIAIGVTLVSVWEIFDGFRQARRSATPAEASL